ncbi:putative MFS transporter [Macroventuria anomochaeta]|uniref:MFS transporter n=1 Tax=Macroventuria anomochaeta TaxID=301207 RepID=A0ACB6S9Q5_9PLEO|nr:putative MFS transporter [Macroventuria anomochaeta]KAF2631026.1 putative MFS transporter [Macroventuria anomochaeta]
MPSIDPEKAVSAPTEPTGSPEAAVSQPENTLDRVETRASILYDSIPLWRKCIIVFACSWSTLAACFSSTSLLWASKEISEDLNTTSQVVTFSTAGLILAMGMSALVWSPIASIVGRRVAYIACTTILLAFTIGAAIAPTIEVFVAMRVLSGLQGCFYHVAGQTIIAEYFPPMQRGRANSFFLVGTVAGPPLGPLIAGIMVQYTCWRNLLWLQVSMIGLSLVLAFFFVPASRLDKPGLALNIRGWHAVAQFNPLPVFKQMQYPNISFTHLSCGFLSWTQYSLLATPRHVLSTRFGLTSTMTIGLFYIAPATGFLLGTVIGGWFSDKTVRKWIAMRGERLPQDRLNAGMFAFWVVIPFFMLLQGWGLQCSNCSTAVGGLALPIVTSFSTAAGLLAAFASLNTYCAEAIPKKRCEIIAGKYMVQYTFSAISSASAVPLIEAVGTGPAGTIGAILAVLAGLLTFTTAKQGRSMQEWAEERLGPRSSKELPV